MAGEIDGKKFMQLCGEVFFYDEDLLCAIDVRSERFGREWREKSELEVVDLLALSFQFFTSFFDCAVCGGDADQEQIAVGIFMSHGEWLDSFSHTSEFPVTFVHFHDAVSLTFSRFAEYIVFEAGGEEHAVLYARNRSRGNAVFDIFETMEVCFLCRIKFRQTFGNELAAFDSDAVRIESRYRLFAHTKLQIGKENDRSLEFFSQVESFLGSSLR